MALCVNRMTLHVKTVVHVYCIGPLHGIVKMTRFVPAAIGSMSKDSVVLSVARHSNSVTRKP